MSTYNRGVNIFETIESVSSHTEPYHSQYLVDVLKVSLEGDCSLFKEVWWMTAPSEWNIPEHPKILSEEKMGNERRRIDICILDKDNDRVLGIEVKTRESSAKSGQLEQYLRGLRAKYPGEEVMIAYLTPFNRKCAGEKADSLSTVREFEAFSKKFPDHHGRHMSWLDVANISWDGNELWRQHQHYVRNTISSLTRLPVDTRRDRSLEEIFGEGAVSRFWETLAGMKIYPGNNGANINLADFRKNLSSLAKCLIRALEELICDGDGVLQDACKRDDFSENLRKPFLNSPYREIHEALFSLSKRFSYVWIKGERDYAVRVAHKEHVSGVSLITSQNSDRLKTGQLR